MNHLIDEQYGKEIAEIAERRSLSEVEATDLVEELAAHLERRAKVFTAGTLRLLNFCVRVPDLGRDSCLNIRFSESEPLIERSDTPASECALVIDISSRILRHSIGTEWGGEAIKIGYGCEINILDRRAAEANLDTLCVQLLTSYPTPVTYMKSHLLRTAKFLALNLNHMLRNPLLRAWVLSRFKLKSKAVENYDRNIWLLRDGREIRRMYDLPELDL